MHKSIVSLLMLLAALMASSRAHSDDAPPAGGGRPRIEGLQAYEVQSINVPRGIPESVDITVRLEGKPEVIHLVRTSLRSGKARLLLDRGNGKLEEAPLPPYRTYRGTVVSSGARVSASIVDGRLTAMIDLADDTVFIQPMSDFAAGRGASEHILYRHSRTVPFGDHHCGNDEVKLGVPDWMLELPTDPATGGAVRPSEGGVGGVNPYVAEIAFDADYEFYQLNGSSAANTVNDIEAVMNNVSAVYDRDVNISYEFTAFVVRTTAADPYTTTVMNDLLCEFRTKWNATPESEIQRDVAQLFTGKSITGSVIGLAWVGVLCNQSGTACAGAGNLAYSCVESRFSGVADFRTSLSSHEIGHNWQAQHCDAASPCNIMCSVINSCQGTTGTNLKFSAGEQAQILAYRNAVVCDPALPAPIALPFADNFDASVSLNASNWIYSKGALVSTAAIAEPSGTRSLNLDAISNLDYGDDEVRSNYMLLAGLPTVLVLYSTEHIGVEAGKQLVVEYLNSSLDWQVLNTITSNGVNQSAFDNWQHTLPANAKHNRFRLRFRAAVDAQDDDWYIDSVSVVTIVVPSNDECAAPIAIGEGTVGFDTTNASDSTVAIPNSCNEGAGTAMKNDIWFVYNPSCDGIATVSTCGTAAFDTRLAAYQTACPPAGALVACDDNTTGCTGNTSSISFNVAAGAGYYIRVGGITGGGAGTMTVACAPVIPCDADLNGDGQVNGADLAEVLNAWGTPNIDLNGDGTTSAADLAFVLNAWGPCP